MEQRMYGMSTLTWLVNQGCALRKIKENPCQCFKPVESCDLSEKKLTFSSRPRARVGFQEPLGSAKAQPCKCGLVIDVLGLSLVISYTVNPLLIPLRS